MKMFRITDIPVCIANKTNNEFREWKTRKFYLIRNFSRSERQKLISEKWIEINCKKKKSYVYIHIVRIGNYFPCEIKRENTIPFFTLCFWASRNFKIIMNRFKLKSSRYEKIRRIDIIIGQSHFANFNFNAIIRTFHRRMLQFFIHRNKMKLQWILQCVATCCRNFFFILIHFTILIETIV